jgi:hypothetical protein
MRLTLTTTPQPATDRDYLVPKNPARLQTVELSFGKAQVFYPEATAERPRHPSASEARQSEPIRTPL